MRERPILFSAPMVRAVLEGRKTQTRRVVKPQPESSPSPFPNGKELPFWRHTNGKDFFEYPTCPYGQVGDRLWVRETFAEWLTDNADQAKVSQEGVSVDLFINTVYRATGDEKPESLKWSPSIHMPRDASRITLEIVSVRVERLKAISRSDAAAEGVCLRDEDKPWPEWCRADKWPEENFLRLWDSINGPMSHAANPWVWVIEFKRVEA